MALNIHIVINTVHKDVEDATQAFSNSVKKLGHEVVSTVITDDSGQIHLTAEGEALVKDAEVAGEAILHSTLDAL